MLIDIRSSSMWLRIAIATVTLALPVIAACSRGERHDAGADTAKAKTTLPTVSTAPVLPRANYKTGEVHDGGTITGYVRLAGPTPALPDFQIVDDAAICASAVHNNRLTVGTEHGIADAVVYLVNVTQGKPMPLPANGELVVDQNGCQYRPHMLVGPIGANVTFLNSDDMPHNVRVQSIGHDSVLLNRTQGTRGTHDDWLIDRAGPLEVACDYHPWMNAYVFGVANPYYAVTKKDGLFTIKDVPPGTYTLKMWLNGFETTPKRDNQGRTIGYAFGPAYLLERQVEVSAGKTASVTFDLHPH